VPIFFAYLYEISFLKDFFNFHFRIKMFFHPADIVFKMSLRFFEKRSINQFNHQLKERRALIGAQFSIDHIWGEKS